MRKKATILLTLGLSLFLFSCKKDLESASNTIVNDASEDNYKETEFPVETCITKSISPQIGGYIEGLPASYDNYPTKNYPLLIYIHGTASRGDGSKASLEIYEKTSVPGLLRRHLFPANFVVDGNTYQYIVICPQIKSWPYSPDIDALVDYCIKKYRVDTKRIYLYGGSMGGGATWDYAIDHGDRLAAIAPMSGASWPTEDKGKKIAKSGVAVWAFHNKNDPSIPSWYSIDYVNYINEYNPVVPAKLTLFNDDKHNSWKAATDPNFQEDGMSVYEWMLTNHR
ncbi:MAG TPA: hypothetical protein VFW07_21690 [Parafilimonas sp.]|nr:hypothetical protein [Parafilimonas sp.]